MPIASDFHSYNQPRNRSRPAASVGAAPIEARRDSGDQTRAEAFYQKIGSRVTPEVFARVKASVELQRHTLDDALAVARDEGIDPGSARPVIDQIVAEARARSDAEIKAELDPETYAIYQQFEQSQPGGGGPPPDDMAGGSPPDGSRPPD